MPPVVPAKALVRPRVSSRQAGDGHLLTDAVAELIADPANNVVWIVGGPGSGKTTAIADLAVCFATDERLAFLDEPMQCQVDYLRDRRIVVATSESLPKSAEPVLNLQPWGLDEAIELLLAVNPTACGSVVSRFGSFYKTPWNPQVACVVLRQFLNSTDLTTPGEAIIAELEGRLSNEMQHTAAAAFCLEALLSGTERMLEAAKQMAKARCPDDIFKLLRHREFQREVVSEHLANALAAHKACPEFGRRLSADLIELIASRCSARPDALQRIDELLGSSRSASIYPMVASTKFEMAPQWRPPSGSDALNLAGGYFSGADWSGIDLNHAKLWGCDFSFAELAGALLDHADVTGTFFDGANLQDAHIVDANGTAARFCGANLKGATLVRSMLKESNFVDADLAAANLAHADLTKADLSGAVLLEANLAGVYLQYAKLVDSNLTGADVSKADLTQCDLRSAGLDGACFNGAILIDARMDDIEVKDARFMGARLDRAHLTGSRLPRVDLTLASLGGAYLAEIDWEDANLRNADFRGATFHMGSSRSGLVGSPIACEGSKTGFYTDEHEELYFKRPEEIRKANLRGADLRGANIEGVDFYLVDLRDALLDPHQQLHVRSCGAILCEDAA